MTSLSIPDTTTAAAQGAPVRLLTLTTLFPNSQQPRHGIFVANRLRHLCATGRVEASIVAAVPWFPGVYRAQSVLPAIERVCGFEVRHPRYVHIPAVGMRMQPDSLARTLLDELRRSDFDAARFDVVDAHYFYPDGVAAARVANELGLPLVISARGTDINVIGEIPFARQRMLQAALSADALIAVSGALAAKMVTLGMPSERIQVLRNGVDTTLFSPVPRAAARERLGLPSAGIWLLGVGNLVPEKGFDLLIRAAAAMPDVRLLLVGEGPLRANLHALARTVAPGRVRFEDNMAQAQLRFVYSAADVLALPSLREGWPNVVLEAIACGTPVVAADVGGVREMLHTAGPCRIVARRNEGDWSVAMRELVDARCDPGQVREYALAFGWEDVIARQCALYEEVASLRLVTVSRRCA
jgi:teichuronic acid biosynthesis glycosyltransferase TuaC